MKKSQSLLILFSAIVVLLSIYLFLEYRPQDTTEDSKASSKNITIINLNSSNIRKIVLKSTNNTLRFEKKNQLWKATFAFPYKQDVIDNLSNVFMGLQAEQVIDESPTDMEQYGLKIPAVIIEVTIDDDKSPKIMYLGDLAPSGNCYYFKLADKPTVYTIPNYNGDKFKLTPADFRDYSLTQIDTHNINYLKLSSIGKPVLEIKTNTITSKLTNYGIGIWQMTKPYQETITIATDKFQPVLDSLASITNAETFVEDNPSDLSLYGLTNPQAELLIKDNKTQFKLLIGKPKNENFIYCRTSDSNTIFTIKRSNLSILDTKPFELIEKFVFIVNIEDVDKISLSGLGTNHNMVIDRKRNPKPKDESDKYKTSYNVDGKKVEEHLFKTIYQNLIGLLVESECQFQPNNKTPDLSMIYYLNKGEQHKIVINFIHYNYDFYAVSRNGKTEFLISKDQVKLMLNKLKTLIK